MNKKLNPGAFRVFDKVEHKYLDPAATKLDGYGNLEIERDGELPTGYSIFKAWPADPERYAVEISADMVDHFDQPAFENDVFKSMIGPDLFVLIKHCRTWAFRGLVNERLYTLMPLACQIIGTVHDSREALEAKAREMGP